MSGVIVQPVTPLEVEAIESHALSGVATANNRLVNDIRSQLADIASLVDVTGRRRRLDKEVPDPVTTIAPRRPPPPVPSADGGVRSLASIVVRSICPELTRRPSF